ncbi:MAG: phosphotransferase [Gammaproteobacteria bacterium]|nr:phosphotransferase [Gammaproteobacteria bacterium]
MTAEVFDTLSTIEGFSDLKQESVSIERLGGLTNRNYKIDTPKGSFVLRLAGEGTSNYIDRSAEFHNASIASRAGVNAEIVHFNVDDGTMICRYIESSVTMDQEKFCDLDAIRRTGRAFRQLHDCGEKFKGDFELFQQIDQYLGVVKDLGAALPEGYEVVQKDAEKVRSALSAHVLPSAPCHCDPMVENCIDNGEQMYIIDFEYAGNNDPMWDLGDLSVEGAFNNEQDYEFLAAYFGHEPSGFDVGRMVMYKAMCDLLWTLWGVVQHANDNPADDFWAYAVERLERCKKLMATDDFPKHLAAVSKGP